MKTSSRVSDARLMASKILHPSEQTDWREWEPQAGPVRPNAISTKIWISKTQHRCGVQPTKLTKSLRRLYDGKGALSELTMVESSWFSPRRDREPGGAWVHNPRECLELQSLLPYPNSCLGGSPHQQGRDTKMLSFCGIDVSKDRLDVIVLPEEQCSSVSNDGTGWADLVERLRRRSIAAIGIEASGGYERGVMRTLLAAGMPVRQVNPFKLRQFARASGVLAKSDPLDARMIASFVAIMPTRPAQRTPAGAAQVAEILAVRRQLSAEKVAAENASRLLEDAMLRRLSRGRIGRLAGDIDLLDKRMVEIVASD